MQRSSHSKNDLRKRRHVRVRARIIGTSQRPRLSIFKSNRFISAQLIDDSKGETLVSAHGREFKGASTARAKAVGETIAKRAKEVGINKAVFDRSGYRYAAQVKMLADAAREGGLIF